MSKTYYNMKGGRSDVILLMPDTENKRAVVATWLESMGFSNKLSDAEPEDGTDWGMEFGHKHENHLCNVSWAHASRSFVLEIAVEMTEEYQRAFTWMGVVPQLLFLGDLVDCISSHHVEFAFEYQHEGVDEQEGGTDEEPTTNVPLPERITVASRLFVDEGISRALFFERHNLLRSIVRRVNVRLDRMHLLKAWA